jgi:RimJ/RimL family protein N-acetyltransferase
MAALPEPDWPLTDGVVGLRRFTREDVPAVTRACQDPEIPRWTAGIPQPYEERDAREWIDRHGGFWAEGQRAAFAFYLTSTGELCGSMTLADVDLGARSAGVGYWAAPWARNRGATTRALDLACRWGFASLELEIVHLMTVLGNAASDRVAEKAGFHLVGTIEDYKVSGALDPDARYTVRHWVRRASDVPPRASRTS